MAIDHSGNRHGTPFVILKMASYDDKSQFMTAMLRENNGYFIACWMQCNQLLEHVLSLPMNSSLASDYAAEFNEKLRSILAEERFKETIGAYLNSNSTINHLLRFLQVHYLCYNTYPLLKLPFDARCVAISYMELKSGFLSHENFKAALSKIQRQPKQECIKDCSILELSILVFMKRLEVKEQNSYNFNSVMKEYKSMHESFPTSDYYAQNAFQHHLQSEIICSTNNRGHSQSIEFRQVRLLVSYAELQKGLKSYHSCPRSYCQNRLSSKTNGSLKPEHLYRNNRTMEFTSDEFFQGNCTSFAGYKRFIAGSAADNHFEKEERVPLQYPCYTIVESENDRRVVENDLLAQIRQNIPTKKQFVDYHRQGLIVEGGVGYRQTVVIRSYEVGADKSATLESILNLFQMVEIETWVGASGKNGMRRDWLIRSQATGHVFARATSTSVMMNEKTRRLSKMPEEVRADISPWFIEKQAIHEDVPQKISKLDSNAKYVNSNLKPKRSDLDMNQHVKNVKYVRWMLGTIPDQFLESHQLSGIILEYRRECGSSNIVQSLCEPDEDGILNSGLKQNNDMSPLNRFSLASEIMEGN
ncbi:origin recognition complex subunit 4 family protein [Populus alba x Populus x berolinensis]|nr:origin recognition complex subunit 4 family protein [Populus alba x Populus x berolinensis]